MKLNEKIAETANKEDTLMEDLKLKIFSGAADRSILSVIAKLRVINNELKLLLEIKELLKEEKK